LYEKEDVKRKELLIPGHCTPAGTLNYLERAKKKMIPKENFRKPILEDQ
jgi:hypothetical protein